MKAVRSFDQSLNDLAMFNEVHLDDANHYDSIVRLYWKKSIFDIMTLCKGGIFENDLPATHKELILYLIAHYKTYNETVSNCIMSNDYTYRIN